MFNMQAKNVSSRQMFWIKKQNKNKTSYKLKYASTINYHPHQVYFFLRLFFIYIYIYIYIQYFRIAQLWGIYQIYFLNAFT